MIKDELLESIDNIDYIQDSCISDIVEATVVLLDKNNKIYQESTNNNPSFINKIINGLKKVLHMILSVINKAIDKIKSLFHKNTKDVNSIASSVIGNSVHTESYVMEAKQGIDYLTSHGKSPDDIGNDIYVQTIGTDTIRINFLTDKIDSTGKKNKDTTTANKISKNRYAGFDMFYRITRQKYLTDSFEKSFKKLIDDVNNRRDHNQSLTDCKKSFREFDRAKRLDDRETFGRPTDDKYFDLSIKDMIRFQSFVSEVTSTADTLSKDIYSTLDKDVSDFLVNVSHIFINMQMTLNAFSNAIDTDSGYVAPMYRNKIKTPEKLGEFVRKLIDSGISPKYVAYNAWLIANKSLKGNNKRYDPKAGQSRVVFFPEDDKIVYKIAMSGFGVSANNNEDRVTKMVKSTDVEKHFALILDNYSNGAVVKQQRTINDFYNKNNDSDPIISNSYKRLIESSKAGSTSQIIQDIEEWQRDNKIPNPISITDLHAKNFGVDTRRGVYVIFDYGMLVPDKSIYDVKSEVYNIRKQINAIRKKFNKGEITKTEYESKNKELQKLLWDLRDVDQLNDGTLVERRNKAIENYRGTSDVNKKKEFKRRANEYQHELHIRDSDVDSHVHGLTNTDDK